MDIKIRQFDSYISAIRNSVGSHEFKNLWADVDGKRADILDDGRKSCGYFVSGILLWFGLIERRHATVEGTVHDMEASGWERASELKIGDVIRWEHKEGGGEANEHIGFFIGDNRAISTSATQRVPVEHHVTYGEQTDGSPVRKIIAIYRHPRLNS